MIRQTICKYLPQIVLFALTFSIAPSAYSVNQQDKNILPEMGTVASSTLSIEKEKIMGDIIRRQLRAQAPVIYDPLLSEYLSHLGNKLVAKADDVKYPFHFFALKEPSLNAFATFGGTVVIHSETLIEAQTESEFASVLAHEIAHVTQRHIARKGELNARSSAASMAALLGSVILTMINPSVGTAALMTTTGAQQQMALNYTRHHEKEADRIGLQTLIQAGFNPKGAETFFGRLAEQQRYTTKKPPMLYSHPLPEARMADIKARVDSLPYRFYSDNDEFQFIRTRTLTRNTLAPDYHEKAFKHHLKSAQGLDKILTQYGLALALIDLKKYSEAKALIDELLTLDPNNLHFVDALTDAMIGLNKFDEIFTLLDNYLQKRPNNQVIVLNYANALTYGKQYNQAIDLLKDFILLYPEHHLAWQLLTEAYLGNEQASQYHQAKAEVYAQKLGYLIAIDELHTGYNKTPKENIADRKRISARIKQFREAQDKLTQL
ncbi:M48 family metalloprotease [Algibacillus agarilyticus]|uniref:M48 family metalloprotease n=1 Tax=Algibacillus agarilyticus TaxID=2234133 RepID=UPI000DCFD787|nr:M48 family metalloprotease [Algibacillus agarilyticus]